VDHAVTDQTSVLRFVEDTFLGGQRIGQGSFDSIASSIGQMFNFTGDQGENGKLILDPSTGQPTQEDGQNDQGQNQDGQGQNQN
jgi:phospholipase C